MLLYRDYTFNKSFSVRNDSITKWYCSSRNLSVKCKVNVITDPDNLVIHLHVVHSHEPKKKQMDKFTIEKYKYFVDFANL